MKMCPMTGKDRAALLSGDPEEAGRMSMKEHLEKCPECRSEAEEFRRLLEGADGIKAEIRAAVDSVDWEALPARITDHVFRQVRDPDKVRLADRFRGWTASWNMKPVLAGLVLGLTVGAAVMYLALRTPGPGPRLPAGYHASGEFLDRVEIELARRQTLDYLEKSQHVLRDIIQAPAEPYGSLIPLGSERARDLLQMKGYLNPQLDKFQMAKAKAICDQIEILFLELAQISEDLPAAELRRIQHFIEDRQILLKISLVKRELQRESEI
jgi:hypothetical protein